jgi:hypothetical protein
MKPDEQSTDPNRQPIRKPRQYFAWAGTGVIALAAATALVAGGTAVWSAVTPGQSGGSPAPVNLVPQAAVVSPTPDDKGGLRKPGTVEPGDDKVGLRKPTTARTTEPGDDKGGLRKPGAVEPGDDSGGHHGSGSGKSSDDKGGHHGSGKSSDDPAGHH